MHKVLVVKMLKNFCDEKATEWRGIMADSLKKPELQKPSYDEELNVMLVTQELQEIVNKELSGYKVKLEKSEK
jgi:hypothetical protein